VCKCADGFHGALTLTENTNTYTGTCEACAPISYSTGPVVCTTGSNSVSGAGFACLPGFTYVAPADAATAGVCEGKLIERTGQVAL
jgi:hypothetical protein